MAEPVASEFQSIPLAALHPSLFNPRSQANTEQLQELAASIRAKGVLEPLLVRPLGDGAGYQIVAGHRRFQAARLVNLQAVPCVIRTLTDAEALEASIVENLQREGVSELDEAKGYDRLMHGPGKEARGLTVKEIAQRVGKSEEYVYARLKLLALGEVAVQALRAGEITAGHAVMIARMTPGDQVRAVKYCRTADWQGAKPTVRDLMKEKGKYERSLKGVAWKLDDGKLLPAAGNCTDCPQREGSTCHDVGCYQKKEHAALQAVLAAHPEALRLAIGYLGANGNPAILGEGEWKEAEKKCDYRKAGVIVEIGRYAGVAKDYHVGAVLTVCAEKRCKLHFPGWAGTVGRTRDYQKQVQRDRARRAKEETLRRALLQAIGEKVKTLGRFEIALGLRQLYWSEGNLADWPTLKLPTAPKGLEALERSSTGAGDRPDQPRELPRKRLFQRSVGALPRQPEGRGASARGGREGSEGPDEAAREEGDGGAAPRRLKSTGQGLHTSTKGRVFRDA